MAAKSITGRPVRVISKPGFWLILALLILISLPHYIDSLQHPAFLNQLMASLKLERHAFERILYLIPIVWAGFLFSWKEAAVTSLVALAIMLPRAILLPGTQDSLFETSAVVIIGNVLSISFEALRKAREQRSQLEMAHRELQYHTRTIEESEKRLSTLNQIANTVSQSLELSQVLNSAIDSVIDVMVVDGAWIYLLDQDKNELVLAAHRGVSQEFARDAGRIKVGEGFSGDVAETGRSLFVEDASRDPRLAKVAFKDELHSALIVPLSSKGKVNGTLGVNARKYRSFQQGEIELLTAIGNQIGVAIDNASLYQRQQEVAAELRASEARYRELFENAHDAIWIHNLDGKIISANQATAKLTGYSADELLDMNVRAFLSAESLRLAGEIREKLLGNEPVVQPYEQRIFRKDGSEAFIQLTTSVVFTSNKPMAFQHIARDVSEERRLQENLRFYLHQATRAQEEERKRISRELHDETIQALVVLSRSLDALASGSNGLSEENRLRLEELRQETNNIMRGVRRLSQDLRPAALDRLGLLSALEWLAADVTQYSGIATKVTTIGSDRQRRHAEEVELVLFRITQEAMRNVWRHSGASQAEIVVNFGEKTTSISIRDNGRGFDVPKTMGDLAREGKLGLAGMQERAHLIGGVLTAQSEPGKGSAITVEIPA